MLLDARTVPTGRVLETDLCVVGAGAAGIAIARALAAGPFRVALLESGGLDPDVATQSLYRGRIVGRDYFRLDECRRRQLGGSTNCWHGLCRPLDPSDFERRDWVPDSGWPFDAEVLRPFYARAQDVLGLGAFEYTGEHWASPTRPPLPLASGAFRTQVFQVAPHRLGELYRAELARAPNVEVWLFANVVELDTDESGRTVQRVRVACLGGTTFSVRARLVVLATGGIENARLLLVSRRARPAGLGNDHDLVGRYFMEHPHVVAGVFVPSTGKPALDLYRLRAAGPVQVVGYLTASPSLQRAERLLAFSAFLAQEEELRSFEASLARVIHEMDGGSGRPSRRAIFLMSALEQAPNPASRVRLGEEGDALGVPRVELDWRLSALDKRSAYRAQQLLGRELARAGLGRLQVRLSEDDHEWPRGLSGGRHHMGTTRMHADPRRGVVDANGRVHGMSNLYMAGSSVFPTGGAANPTLTIVALALRLADHLRERLR